jgi:ATP-dependent DNA ligase
MSARILSEYAGHYMIQRKGLRRMYVRTPQEKADIKQANIELFRSFLPQLCYRSPSSSHEAVAKLVGAPNEFVREEKLDGERMQLHMRGNGAQWVYWSRKAKDYSTFISTLYWCITLMDKRTYTVHMWERGA